MGNELQLLRLGLRRFVASDAADLARLMSHPRVSKYIFADRKPTNAEEALSTIAEWASLAETRVGMGYWRGATATGEFLGAIWLLPLADDIPHFGGALLPAAWGRSIALEASAGLIDHSFATLELQGIQAFTDHANRPARAVLASCGFSQLNVPTEKTGFRTLHVLSRHRWMEIRQTVLRQPEDVGARRLLRLAATSRSERSAPAVQDIEP